MNHTKPLLYLFLILMCCVSTNAQNNNSINQVPPLEKRFIESSDKKIRLHSTLLEDKSEDGLHYTHAIEYDVAPNKVRTTDLHDYRFFSFNALDFPALIIDTIYHVHNSIYLLEGFSGNKYCLMGVDIGRGIAKDAYVLQDLDVYEPSCFVSVSVDTTKHAIEKVRAEFSGNRIRLPRQRDGYFSGGYNYQYFNGAHYEDGISYLKTDSITEGDDVIITRIYLKDEYNRLMREELVAVLDFSVVLDIASKRDTLTSPAHLALQNGSRDKHFQGKLFNVKIPLKVIDDIVFVEGINMYYFPIISQRKFFKKKLHRVEYTAGRKSAFPYEWLRYSAVIFNRSIEDKEWQRIHWALDVDGELQLLEGENWQGPQIDLQMRDEWLNKKILVIPYIEGNPINRKVAIETTIVPY